MWTILLGVLAGLASGSTLAKNEFNCSLAALAECTAPHLVLPGMVAPTPRAPVQPAVVGARLAYVPVGSQDPYEGVTGYDNPSLGGR